MCHTLLFKFSYSFSVVRVKYRILLEKMASRTFTSHIVDVTALKEGDHIYRHTNMWAGCSKFADLHHGIVYSLPQTQERFLNEGIVFEITKEEALVKSSLKKFKNNRNIRKAYNKCKDNNKTLADFGINGEQCVMLCMTINIKTHH